MKKLLNIQITGEKTVEYSNNRWKNCWIFKWQVKKLLNIQITGEKTVCILAGEPHGSYGGQQAPPGGGATLQLFGCGGVRQLFRRQPMRQWGGQGKLERGWWLLFLKFFRVNILITNFRPIYCRSSSG